MSGLVRTYSAWSRVQSRCSRGLSPSWVATRTSSRAPRARPAGRGRAPWSGEVERRWRRAARAGRGSSGCARQGRQLVAERLAGRRAGGEHDVRPACAASAAVDLVPPRRVDPAGGVRRPDVVGHPRRPVGLDGRPGGQHLEVGQPVLAAGHGGEPLDHVAQRDAGEGLGRHASIIPSGSDIGSRDRGLGDGPTGHRGGRPRHFHERRDGVV